MLENGLDHCTCEKTECEYYAKCVECIKNHEAKGSLPFCKRDDIE